MSQVAQAISPDESIHIAGAIAIFNAILSAIGVVLLMLMFISLAAPIKVMGTTVGHLNDISVALQYLLTIPIALALHRILRAYRPGLMGIATPVGIASMLAVVALQLLLIFGVLTFEQQGLWVSLAMILGVGFWLVVTGLVARSTGRLPGSLLMSLLAVPYLGYPLWAFWLGRRLLEW